MPVQAFHLFRRSLSTSGLLVGTLLFAASLSPSLVPRPFPLQALLSGVAFAAGYGTGVFLHAIWRFLELPECHGRARRITKKMAWVLCALTTIGFLLRASAWQNSVRAVMALPPVESARPLAVGTSALLLFVVLLGLGRLFLHVKRRVAHTAGRFLPPRLSLVFGAVVALCLFWGLASGVLARLTLHGFDASFQQLDRLIEDDLAPPTNPLHAGAPLSLLDWKQLGRQGRRFVADTPTVADLQAFAPGPVEEPLRVYVGVNSAASIAQRADLALAELRRIGAFEREHLVVITPTGTGWVDPGGIRSLEYLVGGRVASVAVQYSYLPSWLSLLAQPDYGEETARAVFAAIYTHWRALPADARPRLYLFGLSLGALNSERSADIWDLVGEPIDGALWSGPPFRSQTWQWATAQRQAGSPAWRPRFRDGAVIRFANQQGGLDDFAAPWGSFRIAYLQYASDPISFFSPRAFYQQPAWMRGAQAPDVSPALRWYPIVTFLQLAADIAAADHAPIGYGHAYATEHYIDAWHALVEPPGWNAGRLQALKAAIGDLRGHAP